MYNNYELIKLDRSLEVLVIRNAYNPIELQHIYDEAIMLGNHWVQENFKITGVAEDKGVSLSKNKYGFFIDQHYIDDRLRSPYFNYYQKYLHDFLNNYTGPKSNYWGNLVKLTNKDYTLFAKYTKEGYYKPHIDESVLTQLFWVTSDPVKFTGGDLYLDDYDITIDFEINKIVMFPGWIKHTVTPVETNLDELDAKDCRYSFTTLYTIG